MKNILVGLLIVSSLCSFTKKKKKPEAAFKTGRVTATVSTGYPNFFRYYERTGSRSLGPFMAAANYQTSRRWSFGLQYSYHYTNTGIQTARQYTSVGGGSAPVFSHEYQYQIKVTYHSFMATADYCYLNRGRVCLSSGIGLGYMPRPTRSEYYSDNMRHSAFTGRGVMYDPFPAFRARLVHARVRIKDNFGVCGGLGIGTDGLFSVGAVYTFKGRYDD